MTSCNIEYVDTDCKLVAFHDKSDRFWCTSGHCDRAIFHNEANPWCVYTKETGMVFTYMCDPRVASIIARIKVDKSHPGVILQAAGSRHKERISENARVIQQQLKSEDPLPFISHHSSDRVLIMYNYEQSITPHCQLCSKTDKDNTLIKPICCHRTLTLCPECLPKWTAGCRRCGVYCSGCDRCYISPDVWDPYKDYIARSKQYRRCDTCNVCIHSIVEALHDYILRDVAFMIVDDYLTYR
jgi:hypothetical protein